MVLLSIISHCYQLTYIVIYRITLFTRQGAVRGECEVVVRAQFIGVGHKVWVVGVSVV